VCPLLWALHYVRHPCCNASLVWSCNKSCPPNSLGTCVGTCGISHHITSGRHRSHAVLPVRCGIAQQPRASDQPFEHLVEGLFLSLPAGTAHRPGPAHTGGAPRSLASASPRQPFRQPSRRGPACILRSVALSVAVTARVSIRVSLEPNQGIRNNFAWLAACAERQPHPI
jgi:hypothetical protein